MKFLGIVIIFFCGFLTTFTMLARGDFTPGQILWIMINVCFPTPLVRSELMMQQVLSWVRLERNNYFDPMADQGMKFNVDRLVSKYCRLSVGQIAAFAVIATQAGILADRTFQRAVKLLTK